MAAYGVFAVAPGMRGRDSASGSPDASARECMDISDVVTYIRSNFASQVSSTRAAITGYSGGGGNVLAMAAKFPDLFVVGADHFGMSDYGSDATFGWWQQNGSYRTNLNTMIGDTPANVPNAYYARKHLDALSTNFTSGHLFVYHDTGDASVNVNHSQRINALSMPNVTYHETNGASDPRWIHGDPIVGNPGAPNIYTEQEWLSSVVAGTYPVWSVPTSGTATVMGYIVTKRFEIWLGTTTRAGAGGGLNEVATVSYNTTTHQYTVTPLTGPLDVYVKEGALSGTASGISTPTVITVA